uniref:ANK_REP_REGION domain-containing protein n=1 Tax=Caenorhabditis tropicalis TaxID=1561998 RepID=A0A1I7T977_9PELO
MLERLPFDHFYFMSSSDTFEKLYIEQHDAPSEEQVEEWLATGEVLKLEQIVLDGRGHMLKEKKTVNTASNEFLSGLTQYLTKIDAIHKAVEEGDVRRVKSLIDRPLLATARDNYGMTPLHKALLHGQTNTVRFLLQRFSSCVNSTDHVRVRPYKCEHCEKSFTQRCSLESHLRKVHGVTHQYAYKERRSKVFVCEDCGYTDEKFEVYLSHIKTVHPFSAAYLRFTQLQKKNSTATVKQQFSKISS